MFKHLIPNELKLQVRILERHAFDVWSGAYFRFPKKGSAISNFPPRFSLTQPIRPGEFSENKIHNLRLAATLINNMPLPPGSVFSFWHFIGRPNTKRGYRAGRNLIGGKLQSDIGGGLCQLSGILHHLIMMAGLPILERHRHSFDIYEEHERFAPLGSDATVVFGRKDLRFENVMPFPVSFFFEVKQDSLTAHFCSPKPVQVVDVQFVAKHDKGKALVQVRCKKDGKEVLVWEEVYPKLK